MRVMHVERHKNKSQLVIGWSFRCHAKISSDWPSHLKVRNPLPEVNWMNVKSRVPLAQVPNLDVGVARAHDEELAVDADVRGLPLVFRERQRLFHDALEAADVHALPLQGVDAGLVARDPVARRDVELSDEHHVANVPLHLETHHVTCVKKVSTIRFSHSSSSTLGRALWSLFDRMGTLCSPCIPAP